MARTNFTTPPLIDHHRRTSYRMKTELNVEHTAFEAYDSLIERHEALLQSLFRWIDNQNQVLTAYGPHYETELGGPVAAITEIYRKGASE
jgi:hypothetical protein